MSQALTIKLSEPQRIVIEKLADKRNTTLGEAARMILSEGMRVMDLVV